MRPGQVQGGAQGGQRQDDDADRVGGQRSVQQSLDNCYRDYAVNNAQQFMDLLNSSDVPVAEPKG